MVALGHNLDDMAQTVLMNLTAGEVERSRRLAPHTERPAEGLAPRIVPLRLIPEQEVHLVSMHRGLPIHNEVCPNAEGALRWRMRTWWPPSKRTGPARVTASFAPSMPFVP